MITISPAFGSEGIPVVYAADEKFLPNTAVAVYSVIKQASPQRCYDIILLHNGVGPEAAQRLCSLAAGRENISVRAYNVAGLFEKYTFYTANRPELSEVAYYRLLIPWLLPEYDRVVYLDGDTLARADVAELYGTDMGEKIIGAALDMCLQAAYYDKADTERDYRTKTLKMAAPERYFNSGVLLWNTETFRREFTPEQLLEKAVSRQWKCHDQDVLNSLCSDRVLWLTSRWNAIETLKNHRNMPQRYYDEYLDALGHPYILHFCSTYKPWEMPRMKYADEFWLLAIETPFYRELLSSLCRTDERMPFGYDGNEEFILRFRDGKVGFRYILRFAWAWLMFKLKGRETNESERKA